jgi:NADH-quinone oxidoreductase subunit F
MNNLKELRSGIEERYKQKLNRPRIVVGLGTCGIAAGGNKVMDTIKAEVAARGLDVDVDITSCIGMCYAEPAVEISCPAAGGIRRHLSRQGAAINESHFVGRPGWNWRYADPRDTAASYEGISVGQVCLLRKAEPMGLAPGRTNPKTSKTTLPPAVMPAGKSLTMERQAVIDE